MPHHDTAPTDLSWADGLQPDWPAPVGVHAFFTTRSDGLGLGLNICRSIIESMGGQLQARNREGGGAIFEIRLPLANAPESPLRTPGNADAP